jgi:aminomethyltransferase
LTHQSSKTHLYDFHAQHGKLVPFAGFEMPIWYKGVIPEHLAVRNSVGLFDVTHMGRVTITGADAVAFLNYVTANDVSTLKLLDAQYSLMCNEKGGIKDDFVLSRQEDDRFFMVYNAANRDKNYQWLTRQASDFDVNVDDLSECIAMFAVQGPKAQATLQKVTSTDLTSIRRFKCGWAKIAGSEAFVSRTGYTGEDGFEVFILDTPVSSPECAIRAWSSILDAGKEFSIEPCGLGARDTLRLEAGLCLYGNDIDENTTPLEARISFVVKLQKEGFIGKEALVEQKAEGVKKTRIGLRMLGAGIPRQGQEVLRDQEKIGYTTSGTYSPLLKLGVAIAYVNANSVSEGDSVSIAIRGKPTSAQVAKFPLYDSSKYGSTRKETDDGSLRP